MKPRLNFEIAISTVDKPEISCSAKCISIAGKGDDMRIASDRGYSIFSLMFNVYNNRVNYYRVQKIITSAHLGGLSAIVWNSARVNESLAVFGRWILRTARVPAAQLHQIVREIFNGAALQ